MSRAIECDCCGVMTPLPQGRRGTQLPDGWIKLQFSLRSLPRGAMSWNPEGRLELCEACDFIDPRRAGEPHACPHKAAPSS